MEALIHVVSDLQTVFQQIRKSRNLNLPKIVVIGLQSSGKSTTLEGIVGKEFLPRGEGVVTRTPIKVELVHINKENDRFHGPSEWAVFPEQPEPRKQYTDFSEVQKEIARITEQKAPGMKVCDSPITLRVYSPNVSDLTLLDLPGVTEVAMVGLGQPEDFPQQTQEVAMNYIKDPNSIILAVHPADSDTANCSALRYAKQVDPHGSRTIAVITKIDRAGGKDLTRLFSGQEYPLKLGIIGVYNRCTNNDPPEFSIEDAKKREKEFMMKNFPSFASRMGTDYLAKRLAHLLIAHIQKNLVDIKGSVEQELLYQKHLYKECGEPIEFGEKENEGLNKILQHFCQKLTDYIEGNFKIIPRTELVGGASIKELFIKDFPQQLSYISLPKPVMDHILIVIRNAAGVTANLFTDERAFQLFVREYVRTLNEPSLELVDEVHLKMGHITDKVRDAMEEELGRFPELEASIMEKTTEFLRTGLEETKRRVQDQLDKENAYININHPDARFYLEIELKNSAEQLQNVASSEQGDSQAETNSNASSASFTSANAKSADVKSANLSSANAKSANPSSASASAKRAITYSEILQNIASSDTSGIESDLIDSFITPLPKEDNLDNVENPLVLNLRNNDALTLVSMVRAYYRIVRKNVLDMVPKTIMLHLVNHTKNCLYLHLYGKLNKEAAVLLRESQEIIDRREQSTRAITELENASRRLDAIKAQKLFS